MVIHRRNNRGDRGDWSPTFRLGDQCIGPPNFSPLMSTKATRMKDLASEITKKFPGVIPRTPTAQMVQDRAIVTMAD